MMNFNFEQEFYVGLKSLGFIGNDPTQLLLFQVILAIHVNHDSYQ